MAETTNTLDLSASALAFAAAVKSHRSSVGVSQAGLASQMQAAGFDFHAQTVYKIESGRRAVSVDEAFALAEILGFSVEKIMGGVPEIESKLKDVTAKYSRVLSALFFEAGVTATGLRDELKAAIQAERLAGKEVPKGYTQLADFGGLELFIENYGVLLKQKAAASVMSSEQPSQIRRALDDAADRLFLRPGVISGERVDGSGNSLGRADGGE
jgi:transcriptional regulator with XRE-family HTH domain